VIIKWKTYSLIFTISVILIAILGLLGYVPGWQLLASGNPKYIPMAPSTIILFILSALALLKFSGKGISYTGIYIAISVFITLFGLTETIGFFVGAEINFENLLVPEMGYLNGVPVARMSPSTGILFFVSGLILFLLIAKTKWPEKYNWVQNFHGFLNLLLLISAFIFVLAYLYGKPLLYGSPGIIPMALTTALAFLLLSFAFITREKNAFPLSLISGNTTRSFLLRYILPITIISFILGGLVVFFSLSTSNINPAILASVLTILLATGAVVFASLITRHLGRKIDRQKNELNESRKVLQESEEQIRLLLDSTAEGIYGTDTNGICTFVNKAALELLKYKNKKQLIGKNMHDVLHHPAPHISENEYGNCSFFFTYKTGVPAYSENIFLNRSDRSKFRAEFVSLPIQRNNKITGSVVTFWDITERKKSEEELFRLKNELEIKVNQRTVELQDKVNKLDKSQTAMLYMVEDLNRITTELKNERQKLQLSNEELEAFTYSVSHDLRAPLRAIKGFSNFLREDYSEKLDNEGKRFVDTIRNNASKMDRLITTLLNLSRVSRVKLNFSEVDMKAVAQSMFIETASEKENEQFEVDFKPMSSVKCDLGLIKQVWQNLISNSLKYSSKSDVKKIEIGSEQGKGETTFYVKDFGAGFNPKYKNKLFGPFQRLHKDDEFEGTGVGLAVTHRIITRHGGRIWAESELNKGATFWFSIPNNN
jgi:PAS domain S-box-containing protein